MLARRLRVRRDHGRVWKLFKNSASGQSTLHQSTIAALGTGTWHNLALQVSGNTITAWVDTAKIGSWTDSSYSSGMAGIEAGAFGPAGRMFSTATSRSPRRSAAR